MLSTEGLTTQEPKDNHMMAGRPPLHSGASFSLESVVPRLGTTRSLEVAATIPNRMNMEPPDITLPDPRRATALIFQLS